MSVLDQGTGRGDIIVRRGVTTMWGVLWEQSSDGVAFAPVILSEWTGVLELRSPFGDVWLSKPTMSDSLGLTTVTLTPADTADAVWAGRGGGAWIINLTSPAGRVERLAEGYFHLEA